MKSPQEKLDQIAERHNTHTDFDGVLSHYRSKLIASQVAGLRVLECGCSTGVMTSWLVKYARELDVVEGSAYYAKLVADKYQGQLKMFCSLFEEFRVTEPYEVVVFVDVLHHLETPIEKLQSISTWVKSGGIIHITVPNMTSFHRQLGVTMGLTKAVNETSVRNTFFNQPGRFTQETLVETVSKAGLEVEECYGFFFKPFPHEIMNIIRPHLSEALLDGLFEIGKQYPQLACQLYLKARRP